MYSRARSAANCSPAADGIKAIATNTTAMTADIARLTTKYVTKLLGSCDASASTWSTIFWLLTCGFSKWIAGTTVAALLQYVFGSIDSNFWGVAAGLTLGIAAAGLFMLGLGSMFGKVRLAVGAALALLLGNPLSGLTSAPEMLPAGWGQLGQLLPQGATATLLRSTAYFGGAGADLAIIVLSCWALAGVTLVIITALRRPGRSTPRLRLRGTR